MKKVSFETGDVVPFDEINLSAELEETIKKWKDDVKQRLTQKGILEKLTTDVGHVIERTNCLSPNPDSNVDISFAVYQQLYQEIQTSVHTSLSRDITQQIESDDVLKQTIRSTVLNSLDKNKDKYGLETNQEKIKTQMSTLESSFTENKKEKKTKKRKIEEVIPDDEPFITCGIVNSRGRPCMRRQGTCPYHSIIRK
jgi:hypothetical protein